MPRTPDPATAIRPLPKGPVLGWRSLAGRKAAPLPSVRGLPHCVPTTSGRAALYHALQALALPPHSGVLVPSYHCPTMVAPVLRAGLQPLFYPVGADGLPALQRLPDAQRQQARAIIVAHFFGLVQPLAAVRAWCDEHGIALIEDCAHALFGRAGGAGVGTWGDYATASISKFLPVPEMGLLASARRPLPALALQRPTLRAQLKGVVDVLEQASRFHRPALLSLPLRLLFGLKNARRAPLGVDDAPDPGLATEQAMYRDCDMGRVDEQPVLAARAIHALLPLERLVRRRQRHFDLYARHLSALPGARPLVASRPPESAPYVFPLWVDDAERVYERLRAAGMPVFRWDRIWPHTPLMADDVGPAWSRHVLQLLCHQDLGSRDVARVIAAVQDLLRPVGTPTLDTATA